MKSEVAIGVMSELCEFECHRPRTPEDPLIKLCRQAGFLASGSPADSQVSYSRHLPTPTAGQWFVALSFRLQWRGPRRSFTGFPRPSTSSKTLPKPKFGVNKASGEQARADSHS